MHDDEIPHDVDLVRRLLAAQHPAWAGLTIEYVPSTGTDNALYRLGDDLVVRLPLRPGSTRQIDRVARWLPVLAPHLPLAVPVPVAKGEPTDDYPWGWSIVSWIPGEDATTAPLDRGRPSPTWPASSPRCGASTRPAGRGPAPPTSAGACRWRPRDQETRRWIEQARGMVDTRAVTAALGGRPVGARPGTGRRVWLHGDIASGNLLVGDGRISAVDRLGGARHRRSRPATCSWRGRCSTPPGGRPSGPRWPVDDATWARGRGWALSTAIIALPYYEGTNAFMADQARRKIAAVLAD